MPSTKKRVALVTGGNRGIGLAISRKLAEKDLIVIIGCREEEKGKEAQDVLRVQAGDVHFTPLDVTDTASIMAALGRTEDQFGRLDVLVNNAGIMIDGETNILEMPLTTLLNTLETNAFGPLQLCQGCAQIMKKNGYGRIVNIASTLGSLTGMFKPGSPDSTPDTPAYRLSKIVLNGITVLLARALQDENILVNSVCPGWVRTDLGGPEAPLSPEEAAETPVWLATLPDDGPTGGFFRERTPIPW